jgi:hypothetical protein
VRAAIVSLLLTSALVAAAAAQTSNTDATTIDAKLGPCSADFTVTDADGKAIYDASVHVRVRYGAFGVKRMDLEVGTNSSGRARVQGLPSKARPLAYDVSKGDHHASVTQDVAVACNAAYDVTLE